MKTVSFNVYEFSEHPNKDAVVKWVTDNWNNLHDYESNELVASLNAAAKTMGGKVDYSISTFPDRGEYLKFQNCDFEVIDNFNPEDLPLTGMYWDFEVIQAIQKRNLNLVIDAYHKACEYIYGEENIAELCGMNVYYFYEDGRFYHEK